MKTILSLIIISILFFGACTNQSEKAINYNDQIINQQQKIVQLFNKLDSSFADTVNQSFKTIYQELMQEVEHQLKSIDSFPDFDGNNQFKQEYKTLLTVYQDVVKNDYSKMIDLYTLPDSLYTQNVKDDFFISDIFTNSKYVRNKSVFVCIEGENYDGHQFISESIDKGCVLLISKKEFSDIPNLLVKDPRSLLGIASSIIYENPCDKLLMYAVTGTNGKSTTSFFLKYILDNIGIKTGLLGTILYDDGRYKFEADRTTPEASDIQRYLYIMNKNRCRACVMEVSSHGLCMNRIEGSSYDAGIFTNLSEEHLDYHITMESYFNAKKKLFDKYMKKEWKIATNIDNNYGSKMYEIFNSNAIPYGLNRKNVNCNFFAKNVILENTGSFFDLEINGLFKKFFLPLPGKFNIYNILAAISIVTTQCNDIDKIIEIGRASCRERV